MDEVLRIREKVTDKLLSLDRALEPLRSALLWLLDVSVDDRQWQRADPPQRRQRALEQFAEARTLAERSQAIGEKFQDVRLQLYASHNLGLACHTLGDYRRASEILRTIGRSAQTEWAEGALGGMVTVSWAGFQAITLGWLARCLAEQGEFEEGMTVGHQAIDLAEDFGNPYSLAAACIGLAYNLLVRGEAAAASCVLERAHSIACDASLALYRPQARRLLGNAYLLAGRIDEGLRLVQAAADEVQKRRLLMQHAPVLALFGEACLLAGRVTEASAAAQRALTFASERGQRGEEAVARRLLGEIASHANPPDAEVAEDHCRQAIALAGGLGMRPLIAHCYLSLATLYRRTGQHDQAPKYFQIAAKRYREMQMRYWLEKAEANVL